MILRRTKRRASNRNLSIKYGIVFRVNVLVNERAKLCTLFLSNNIGEKNVTRGRSFVSNNNWIFVSIRNAFLTRRDLVARFEIIRKVIMYQ